MIECLKQVPNNAKFIHSSYNKFQLHIREMKNFEEFKLLSLERSLGILQKVFWKYILFRMN